MKIQNIAKTAFLMLMDCLFCWLSWVGSVFVFAYLFRTEHLLLGEVNKHVWIMLVACVLFFFLSGVYKSLWRHPGIGSMLRLAFAVMLSSFSFYVTLRIYMGAWSNPGIGMMAFYFFLTLTLGVRIFPLIYRTVRLYLIRVLGLGSPDSVYPPVRTLLIGAGDSASAFLLHQKDHESRPRKIFGILDADAAKHGYSLHGVRILGGDSKIPELCHQHDIEELIIAVPTMPNEELRRIVKLTPAGRCKVRILSSISSTAPAAGDRLRELNIGDLLGRPETMLNLDGIQTWVAKRTILITGGGGSIGGELCRQLLRFDPEKIVIYDISENNAHNLKEELTVNIGQKGKYRVAVRIGSVQDEARLNEVFEEFRPAIVFHAAAFKHVPLMEQCPRLALENNVLGTYCAAMAARRHGVQRFVMISTDKAVNPTNVMGASKRLAELVVLGLNRPGGTEFVCVRFGNVLDSNGSVVPLFKRQIEAGGPVTVTHPDIIRYFMTIPEAAHLVLEAGTLAKGGEIFILDMGSPVRIVDLAENLIRMSGNTPGIDIKISYTGLRPGEKLFEELLLDEEGLGGTANDKIYVARPEPMDEQTMGGLLGELRAVADGGNDARELLHKYVPEYRDKHSKRAEEA